MTVIQLHGIQQVKPVGWSTGYVSKQKEESESRADRQAHSLACGRGLLSVLRGC